MAAELRDGFKFRSGHLALDLPATVVGRSTPVPTDLLGSAQDLDRWLVAAGLAARVPGASARNLEPARALRESLYRLGLAAAGRRGFRAEDVAILNRIALPTPPTPQLQGRRAVWVPHGVDSLLASIARAGVELLGGESAHRVRACAGTGCSILFFDGSRSGDRRWCSMTACGNRAKLAEFRKRGRR